MKIIYSILFAIAIFSCHASEGENLVNTLNLKRYLIKQDISSLIEEFHQHGNAPEILENFIQRNFENQKEKPLFFKDQIRGIYKVNVENLYGCNTEYLKAYKSLMVALCLQNAFNLNIQIDGYQVTRLAGHFAWHFQDTFHWMREITPKSPIIPLEDYFEKGHALLQNLLSLESVSDVLQHRQRIYRLRISLIPALKKASEDSFMEFCLSTSRRKKLQHITKSADALRHCHRLFEAIKQRQPFMLLSSLFDRTWQESCIIRCNKIEKYERFEACIKHGIRAMETYEGDKTHNLYINFCGRVSACWEAMGNFADSPEKKATAYKKAMNCIQDILEKISHIEGAQGVSAQYRLQFESIKKKHLKLRTFDKLIYDIVVEFAEKQFCDNLTEESGIFEEDASWCSLSDAATSPQSSPTNVDNMAISDLMN